MKYLSDKMVSRRIRILETAQAMMSRGDGHFTMRGLARECGVATATIYNLYGGQDALIADAVADIFERRVEQVATVPADAPLLATIQARHRASLLEVLREPTFARKMMELYFNGDANSRVWKILHKVPTDHAIEHLERALSQGELEQWVDIPRLADQLTRANYATISLWFAGHISEVNLDDEMLTTAYSTMLGALKGETRRQVVQQLQALKPKLDASKEFGT